MALSPMSKVELIQFGLDAFIRQTIFLSLIDPSGICRKCNPYIKLSDGKILLVTLPFVTSQIIQLAERVFKSHAVKTFVLLPKKEAEVLAMKTSGLFVICDPEDVISETLIIRELFLEGRAPKLNILIDNGKVIYVKRCEKDPENAELLQKIEDSFEKALFCAHQ